MKKTHYSNPKKETNYPFCAARIDMKVFNTTTNIDEVTCRLCKMRLGLIPDTRGNWDNRQK
jgi:hypothetical protein